MLNSKTRKWETVVTGSRTPEIPDRMARAESRGSIFIHPHPQIPAVVIHETHSVYNLLLMSDGEVLALRNET